MRSFLSLSAAIVLALILLGACNSRKMSGERVGENTQAANNSTQITPAQTPSIVTTVTPTPDNVRRVTVVELRDALDKGTAIVVDTRGADSYKQNHIKGSISIPVDQIASRIKELPRDKLIVAYCS